MRAPFGDPLRHDDIGDHGEGGGGDQAPAEIEIEDHRHGDEFDDRRRDVEEEEIEHGIDALGPALDDLGHLARAAREVEAQRQAVEPVEHVFGQMARRFLPDAFEHDIPEIVESGPREPAQPVGEHQRHGEHRRLAHLARHRVDGFLVGEGERQRHGLGQQHQHQRDHDAAPQPRIVARPEIGEEPLEDRPAFGVDRSAVCLGLGRHGAKMGTRKRSGNARAGCIKGRSGPEPLAFPRIASRTSFA